MGGQSILHLGDLHFAETALSGILDDLYAFVEVFLACFVAEDLAALVRAIELRRIEQGHDFTRDLA